MDKKLTCKDFKIGQKVTCVMVDDAVDGILTLNKVYKIKDLDFHFWNSVCVKTDKRGYYPMFMKIKYFMNNKYLRKLKLDKIDGKI